MSEKRRFVLAHPVARGGAVEAVRNAPDGHVVEIRPPKRTLDQNAHFHDLCDDLEKSGLPWAGKPRTAAQWKVLLVSGHAVATKEGHDMVPGIEGEFVNLRESTALMSVRRSASLIEYTLAFMAANNVERRPNIGRAA